MNQTTTPKKLKKFETPHTFVILIVLLVMAAILTYIVPAGTFERTVDAVSGQKVVVPGSFHYIAPTPVSLFHIPIVIYQAMLDAADIIMFILLVGGAFEVINETGALVALSMKIASICKGKEALVVPFFVILFSFFGATMGMSTEVMIFVPIGMSVAACVGYDRVTGVAMVALGAACGFTSGILNAFSVGLAQSIAEIPIFSGSWLRILLLIVLDAVTIFYILRYAYKVKKHPEKSILNGLNLEEVESVTFSGISKRNTLTLLVMLLGFVVLIIGVSKFSFWYAEMSATFLVMAVVAGVVSGFSVNKICKSFAGGIKGIAVGAAIIGLSRGIQVVLSGGNIIDTIVFAISGVVVNLPAPVQIIGIYVAQTIISLIITSGSGQAVVTMPIMTPISDLLGLSRQTAVLAFQMGDGFSNSILPTSSATMGFLSVAKIPYSRWLKYMLPLFFIWVGIGAIFVVVASMIGY